MDSAKGAPSAIARSASTLAPVEPAQRVITSQRKGCVENVQKITVRVAKLTLVNALNV